VEIKLSEIVRAVNGKPLGAIDDARPVNRVSTDTRTIEKDDVFFALKGPSFDGHDFLKEAIEKGARTCVVSDTKRVTAELKKTAEFVEVKDTLAAYGDLAKAWRLRFRVPVVGITGSSGKTTVKELVAHVLSQKLKVLKNRGTENNLIGVPKTLLQLDASHEAVILELGTNLPGEIERLASIASPQIGAITLVAPSHLEGLKSVDGVREEKLSLLKAIDRGGVIILNGHDPNLSGVKSGVHRVVRVGLSKEGCDVIAEQVWCHEKGTSFHIGAVLYETPLVGRHNVQNCQFAIAIAAALGVDDDSVKKALSTFKPVPGRLSPKTLAGIYFIDDSYNSNPASFRAALETLRELKIRERKGVVCGDMLELGSHSEELHRQLGALIAELLFDYVIATGPLSAHLVDEALKHGFDPQRIRHAKSSAEAGKFLKETVQAGDRVLVKGSRGMQMEKVFECFTTSSTR